MARLVWACSLALCAGFQLPRSTPPPRHTMHADAASILDSTLSLANSEEFLGGIVGFLPFIARPSAIIKLSGRESATAQSRPSRHRRDASSMAWRCESYTTRAVTSTRFSGDWLICAQVSAEVFKCVCCGDGGEGLAPEGNLGIEPGTVLPQC